MKTTKILDTNVLLDRPLEQTIATIVDRYPNEDVTVLIPLPVLIELDKFKKGSNTINVNCRSTIRFIESLRTLCKKQNTKLFDGIKYSGLTIKIGITDVELDEKYADNYIVNMAKTMQDCEILTEDIHERLVADAFNVESSSMSMNINIDKLYTGKEEISITEHQTQDFYENGEFRTRKPLEHNQFAIIKMPDGSTDYGIFNKDEGVVKRLQRGYKAWGISPKKSKKSNGPIIEQAMLMHLLLDPDIHFVSCMGPSGSGKTFLTLATALEQVINQHVYDKIIVMRPLVAIGEDPGTLPGDKLEKLRPWMASTFDNLEYLLSVQVEECKEKPEIKRFTSKDTIMDLIARDQLEVEAMAYIRGRSIPKQFIIIDDCQNLTPSQVLTILTRAGEGTKVVMLGDINKAQIDNDRLSPSNNGLAYIIDKMRGRKNIAGHITMTEVVRSPLAELAVEIGNEDLNG